MLAFQVMCHYALQKIMLVEIKFLIALAQPFEKYLCMFQTEGP